MKYKHNNMTIYVYDEYDKMSKKCADMIAGQVNLKPNSILGLATGSTPIGTYNKLIDMCKVGEVDFEEVVTFNLDEYYPIDPNNYQSYSYFMRKQLFDHINIKDENIHIPSGSSDDIEEECKKYNDMMKEKGPVDIQLLGIGTNGHIGFNEPDDTFKLGTHKVTLDKETIKSNSRFFDSIDDVPTMAVSMGVGNIMSSEKIIIMANGENKADAIKKMVFGGITPQVPASILQMHKDVIVILDELAAKDIVEVLK